ncbi:sterile alpha motif domain-containing protein 9-like [Littorina saxatilis]|uniref:sterile alpha motif domain-containing protein 9-like n=1 Tax=Littorina saxatilis TaxID=31220 RepID=UPI0038B64AF1
MPVSKGFVEKQEVTVLRDSGCNGVIVKEDLVPTEKFTGDFKWTLMADSKCVKAPVLILANGKAISVVASAAVSVTNMPVSKGFVEKQEVTVLRDSGCNGVIVKEDLVPTEKFTGDFKWTLMADSKCVKAPVLLLANGKEISVVASAAVSVTNMPVSKGFVEKQEVTVLRDSGCNGVIVKEDLVPTEKFTGDFKWTLMADSKCVKAPVTAEYSQEELKPHEDICGTGMQESLHDQHQTMQTEREEIRNTDTSLEKDRIPTNLANSQTPKSSQEEPKSYVTPRGFKDSDVGVYEAGILDTFETAHGMIDPPSREFKLHDCADALDPKAKRAFLLKTLRFVCGCLNSRRNGTIYFGVADKNNEHYKHGEIVGVEMTTEAQSDYCSLLRKFLSEAFPGQETVVPDCVAGPTFVRKKDSCPRKCVVEVDVEPYSNLTENKIFKFDASVVYSFLGEPPKAERQKDVSGVFIRDIDKRTAEPATISLGPQGLKDFKHDRLCDLRDMRCKEEKTSERRKKGIITMEEKQKFKTFIAECDSSRFPIFFVSKPTDAVRENMESCLSFVPRIRWAAIVDFDGDSDKDGLYSLCRTSVSSPNEFTEVPITEFVNNKSNNELRETFNFPVKTPYIFANGKSSGENCFDSLGPNEWKNQYFQFVRTADNFFQDPSVISSLRRLLLVFVSEEAGDEVLKTCDDIRYAFGWENLFFVFDKKTLQSKFREALSGDLIQHSAVLSWRDAQCIIEEVLEFQKKDRSKYVCTASGALVELPPELWRSWEQNLEVLSAKECEEFELTSGDQWRQIAETEEKYFYRGGKVSWLNFYFPYHVMERTLLSDLKHRVSELSEKVKNKEASRVIVGHMPGTGGTTIVKHLLWSLNKKYKCAVVHRITPDTERQICEFWDACECENVNERKPVILIVDNVSNDDDEIDDFALCRRLHRLQKNKNLLKPLAITVICQRSVKRTGDFFLTQDTDDTEKMWLREKQKQLEGNDRLAGEMQTLLGFLSLRHGFDRTSLQKIILPYVNSETLGENERKLIGYIALVMVYFPSSLESPGIPMISCDKLMTAIPYFTTPWEKRLTTVAKYLLVVDGSSECRHNIVRISTYACAEAILETVIQNCSLGDFVTQFLHSDLLTEQSGTSYTTKRIVSKVLIERQTTVDGKNITHMSPLIMAIQAESFEKAAEVLDLGGNQLDDVVFYQQLARLYLKHGEVKEAEVNAKEAVKQSPVNGEYKHTLGLVYLRMLDDAYKENCSIPSSFNETHINNLAYGFESLSNFVLAQKGDDAISVSYAFCDAVKVINLILSYMCKHVLRPEQSYNFGSFLTQEEFCMPDFEVFSALEKDFKTLLSKAQASLKFLYYLGFSYRNKRGRDSLRQARSQFAISYSKDTSVEQSKKLAEKLKVLVRRPDNSEHSTLCHFFRIENLKLQGTFFESIIYYVTLYNEPGISAQNKRDCWSNLQLIRENLLQIPCGSMSGEDMDNFITVCLALQMIRKGHYFTSDKSNLYRFCGTLILCSDQVLQMRAHVYRTLVSWPRNRTTVFNAEEFKISFRGKLSFLKSRKEPLSPRVHFFIARSSSDFHICHWTEIYHSEEDEGSITSTMHQRLEPFHGTVIVYERQGEGQSLPEIMLNLSHLTDEFPNGLKVRALRNENMLSGESVKCYLGFSLQGPVAYIYESE